MSELKQLELQAYEFAIEEIYYDRAVFICVALQRFCGECNEERFPLFFSHRPQKKISGAWFPIEAKWERLQLLQKLTNEIKGLA